jgi:hypothetical protein
MSNSNRSPNKKKILYPECEISTISTGIYMMSSGKILKKYLLQQRLLPWRDGLVSLPEQLSPSSTFH